MADFFELLNKIANEWGLPAAVTVIVVAILLMICRFLLLKLLDAKDKEIDRLVQERNKLQDVILGKRLSSKKTNGGNL